MLSVDRTFQPTRSGTGSFSRSHQPHASGQGLPVIRTLLQTLDHGLQARLRTFPDGLGDRGGVGLQVEKRQQEGRVQIALYWSDAALALVPALRQRLLAVRLAAMAILAQLAVIRTHVAQGAASFCN